MKSSFLKLLMLTSVAGTMLPFLAALATIPRDRISGSPAFPTESVSYLGSLLCAAALCSTALFLLYRRLEPKLTEVSEEQGRHLDSLPDEWVDWALPVAAALSIYLELVLIRWLGTVFPFFAFYKNLTLLACFAGLGLGYAMCNQKGVFLPVVLPLICWQMFLYLYMRSGMTPDYNLFVRLLVPFTEQLHMGVAVPRHPLFFIATHLFLALIFLPAAMTLIPIGQLCGRLMERRGKLKAYGLNLLGSLLGVVFTFVASYLWLPPAAWFAIGFGVLILYQLFDTRLMIAGVTFAVIGVTALCYPWSPAVHEIYSPYQLIERHAGYKGLMEISAAGHFHQRVYDLSLDNLSRNSDPLLRTEADRYELPFQVHKRPTRVAVVGSGTGNDVAAALRMGAGGVDAIEIDPVILELGKKYHPEYPYSSEKVHAVVNDARTFLRTTDNKYDAIIYGLLDSHAMLSQASSVRLDSFVYTVQGLREAANLLNNNGTLWLSFLGIQRRIRTEAVPDDEGSLRRARAFGFNAAERFQCLIRTGKGAAPVHSANTP